MSTDPLANARQLLAAGRVDAATAALRQAARLDPGNAAIAHDIGYLALRRGDWTEAATAFERAVALDDRFALAAVRLGIARETLGQHEAAISAYRTASRIAPERADAPFRLGALLEALGRSAEAERSYRIAAATRPESALSRLGAVRALLAADRLDAAEGAARALLAKHPDHLETTETLGTILADRGELAGAAACFRKVVGASPLFAGSSYDLLRCRDGDADDDALLDLMRAAAASAPLTDEARIKLLLALGEAADDRGDPEEAMRRFAAADAVRSVGRENAGAAIEARAGRMAALFGADRLARTAIDRPGAPRPILVMGLPRSGTTLVEQILSSHPDVHGAGELPFWTAEGAAFEARSDIAPAELVRLGSDYRALLRSRAAGRPCVTDKAPLNLVSAGLAREALGDAMFVICRRRPIDVALSIHRTYFNPRVDFPTGGTALVAAIRALDRLADHWCAAMPGGVLHEVRYETLVRSPDRAIRDLVAACGLPWHDACLAPERNGRAVRTPSRWQVRAPIAAPPPERWRRYEPWLGPLAALHPAS